MNMALLYRAATRTLLCGLFLFSTTATAQHYPEAHRDNSTESLHGLTVNDPYRWMENLESEKLHTWMKAQDKVTENYLNNEGVISSFQSRLTELSTYATEGVPVLRGDKTFVIRREAGQSVGSVYLQGDGSNEDKLVLELESFRESGNIASPTSYSPKGTWMTYAFTEGQSRWATSYMIDVQNGSTENEPLEGIYRGRSNIAWKRDESGFFYTRYEVPENPQDPLGVPRIYYHEIGTSQEKDLLIYERKGDAGLSFTLRVTHDNEYLVISGSESGGAFNRLEDRLFYLPLQDKNAEVRELFSEYAGQYSFEGNDGDQFLIRTSLGAPNLRLVNVRLDSPEKNMWTEIIPEREESILSVNEVGDKLVVLYIKDARTIIRIFDRKGNQHKEIDRLMPSVYGIGDDIDHTYTYYSAFNLTDPGAVFRLHVDTGEEKLHFRPELTLNPDDFVTNQVFYSSKDGTKVPMFLIHRKGVELDGNNPVFMYAYGVWSWSAFPWQGHMIPWMEAGGVYAVPNIRGGGEYGEPWHQAGIRQNKQNGIDDFIAAAEWLIEHDYTSPRLMIANGGSASGILPGAAIIQRPDLFGAAVINYPSLDKIRYTHFGSARSWIPEFGDPEDPDDFKALLAYSPYHNLEVGTCYPPTWIQVGEKDDTTTPMHGYKFAAALQHAQGCDNPVLLKIAWGAGHSTGLTPEQSIETQAQELGFLFEALGITPKEQEEPH